MQSLWSRARPKLESCYRRCRCFTCLAHPTQAALLRRPATTGNALKWSNHTTVLYASLICTAACLDAGFKKKRRNSLDTAISKAEDALAAGQKRQASQLAALGVEARDNIDNAPDTLDSSSEQRAHPKDHNYAWELGDDAEPESVTTPHSSRNSWRDSTVFDFDETRDRREEALAHIGGRTAQSRVLSQSPFSTYAAGDGRNRKRNWTSKKLVTLEYSMAKLATLLLLEAELLSTSTLSSSGYSTQEALQQTALLLEAVPLSTINADHSDSGSERMSLQQKLRQLDLALGGNIKAEHAMSLKHTLRLRYPNYRPNMEAEVETVRNLNVAMSTLFGKCASGHMPRARMFVEIATNLLISPVPPPLSTLTSLIEGLSKAREYALAEAAIRTVFESHVRVDEIALHAMLAHYLRKNDYGGFHGLFKKMEGFHGGLMLAKPTTSNNKAGTRLRYWRGKAIQRVQYDAAIYKALIAGYLRFGRSDLVQSLHARMVADGYKPDAGLLGEQLAQRTRNGEYTEGAKLLDTIQAEILEPNSGAQIVRGSPEHMAVRHMLQYCKATFGTERHADIYRCALERGLPPDALLPRALPLHHARANPAITGLRRRVRVLMQKGEQHAADLQVWALQVLAAKMMIAGHSVDQVREVFYKHGTPEERSEVQAAELSEVTSMVAEDSQAVQAVDGVFPETKPVLGGVEPSPAWGQEEAEPPAPLPPRVIERPRQARHVRKAGDSMSKVRLAPRLSLRREWQVGPSNNEGTEVFPDFPVFDSGVVPVAG